MGKKKDQTEETVVRAFELPVHSVEMLKTTDERNGWDLLRDCWREATLLANWGVQQLMISNTVRLPGQEKCPRPPNLDLYALAVGRKKEKKRRRDSKDQTPLSPVVGRYPVQFFSGCMGSLAEILRLIREKYNDEYKATMWDRDRSPASYRYPHPWPVRSQEWLGCGFDESGKPWITLTLPGGHIRIRLRGGTEFGRQIALFRQVVEGNLPKIQLVIRQQPSSTSCHRPTVMDRGKPVRVMVKMVARLLVREKPGDRVLILETDPNSFWVAELDGKPAWVLNNDHYHQGVGRHEAHLARLQRLSQDAKAERRLTDNRFIEARAKLESLSEKDKRRLDSWTHETAAHLVGYAIRQKVGIILYLDRDRGFIPKFPWHQLHTKLADKCKAAGIEFYSESALRLSGANPVGDIDSNTQVDLQLGQEDEKWQRVARLREEATGKVVAAIRRKGSHPAVCQL